MHVAFAHGSWEAKLVKPLQVPNDAKNLGCAPFFDWFPHMAFGLIPTHVLECIQGTMHLFLGWFCRIGFPAMACLDLSSSFPQGSFAGNLPLVMAVKDQAKVFMMSAIASLPRHALGQANRRSWLSAMEVSASIDLIDKTCKLSISR